MASLKSVILAGEKSDRELLNLSKSVLQHTTLINEYGPTENTITTTSLIGLTAEKSSVIGKPIANNKIYVLGENNNLVPQGVPGELCICGDGLARGYLNKEELTHEKFITCPFNQEERLYKTGDLVMWLPDGNIEFLGRIDQQVKIRGYRIEIGEIETQLLKHASVKEAVVSDKEDKRGDKYLCAYFTAERELTVAELREYLSNELPDYMIPAYFMQVPNMPVTSNGKIDKKSLPEPDGKINTGAEYVAPRTSEEIIMGKIWEDVLKVERIGINDEFLNAGGDSMNALRVITEAKKYNIDMAVRDIFKYKTIENILKNINKSKDENDKQVSESSQEAKVVRVEDFREVPDFYEIYTKDVKELQIEIQRDITIYLYRSLPLCVLLSDPGLHSWYFENYVNIYSCTNSNGLISLDYLELWANYSTVLGEVSLGADIIENENDIIKFITKRLDKKYYVNIAVDEFYLPGKQKYQKIHYIHEVLVYGYDNLEGKLKTIGFDESGIINNINYSNEDFTRAYENGKQYYAESAPWARETAVHLFYHKGFKQPYPFSMERFLNKLRDYINSVGDGSVVYAWAQNEEKVHYGMDVYDQLAKHLKEAIYGKITVDYRAIHLLAEHKKVLAKRFEYIISKFGLEGRIVALFNEYFAFSVQVNKIRLKAYEFESIASDASASIDPKEVVRNISEMVDALFAAKKKESVLLAEIYEILKNKFIL